MFTSPYNSIDTKMSFFSAFTSYFHEFTELGYNSVGFHTFFQLCGLMSSHDNCQLAPGDYHKKVRCLSIIKIGSNAMYCDLLTK